MLGLASADPKEEEIGRSLRNRRLARGEPANLAELGSMPPVIAWRVGPGGVAAAGERLGAQVTLVPSGNQESKWWKGVRATKEAPIKGVAVCSALSAQEVTECF